MFPHREMDQKDSKDTPHNNCNNTTVSVVPTPLPACSGTRRQSSGSRANKFERQDAIEDRQDSGYEGSGASSTEDPLKKPAPSRPRRPSRDVCDAPAEDTNNNNKEEDQRRTKRYLSATDKRQPLRRSQSSTDECHHTHIDDPRKTLSEKATTTRLSSGYGTAGESLERDDQGLGDSGTGEVFQQNIRAAVSRDVNDRPLETGRIHEPVVKQQDAGKDVLGDSGTGEVFKNRSPPVTDPEEDLLLCIMGLKEKLDIQKPIDPCRMHSEILHDSSCQAALQMDSFPKQLTLENEIISLGGSLQDEDHYPSSGSSLKPSCHAEDLNKLNTSNFEIDESDKEVSEDRRSCSNQVDETDQYISLISDQTSSTPHDGDNRHLTLQEKLEELAYCRAMQGPTVRCESSSCLEASKWMQSLEDYCGYCFRGDNERQDAFTASKALWTHSRPCGAHRCVVPFCAFFQHIPKCDREDFDVSFGYLMAERQVRVLRDLYELTELQRTPVNGDAFWAADDTSKMLLSKGQLGCRLKVEGSLSEFGHFGHISCMLNGSGLGPGQHKTVVMKKMTYCRDLCRILRRLSPLGNPDMSFHPDVSGLVSTCLWYRQIRGEKLLVGSPYLLGETFLKFRPKTEEMRMELFKKAVKAALSLHDFGILYLNWKLDHLLWLHDGRSVKICNLSCAVQLSESHDPEPTSLKSQDCEECRLPERVKKGLDPRIAPPEVIEGGFVSRKSDTWGLGCLWYQLQHQGCLPFRKLRHYSDESIIQRRKTDLHSRLDTKDDLISEDIFNRDQTLRCLPAKMWNIIQRRMEITEMFK